MVELYRPRQVASLHLLSKTQGMTQLTNFTTLIYCLSQKVICMKQLPTLSSRDLDDERAL